MSPSSDSPGDAGPADSGERVRLRVLGNGHRLGQQPISFGVPLPLGSATPEARWCLSAGDRKPWPTQTRPVTTWGDGSVKWLHVVGSIPSPASEVADLELRRLENVSTGDLHCESVGSVRARSEPEAITIDSRGGSLRMGRRQDRLFTSSGGNPAQRPGEIECRLLFSDSRRREKVARVSTLRLEESGLQRAQIAVGGRLGGTGLRFSGDLRFFAGSHLIRLRVTVENPRRSRHAGGYWDLGDPGSVLLGDLALEFRCRVGDRPQIAWLDEPGGDLKRTRGEYLEIYQDSSGGENWQSRNHMNRDGVIPVGFRGYRVRTEEGETHGLRANPVVSLGTRETGVALAVEEFWQQFPTAIEVDGDRLIARLLPRQFGDLHEIQGGERNTRVLWIELGSGDGEAACHHLSWIHNPAIVVPEPAEVAASKALLFFPSPDADRRSELLTLLRDALDGVGSFFVKREVVDEFGWRNFGDMWADHEEAYASDPTPVISHYNNQYDLLNSLLVQFLATGDRRWWLLADPLARHLMDIDIYRTQRDRPAYNGGFFWHTAHYLDAGRSTHRSMSVDMIGKSIPAPGGGPASEHNYTSGFLLYHYLTGSPSARETVLGLADWVISMDDGARHVLGVVSDMPTGYASSTGSPSYHGPGRGAGNSINALLDGWLIGGEVKYLDKLEELIRRSIHPQDDVDSLELGDAEKRWSYTVHLQALVRFVELTRECPALDDLRDYVIAALLRYGRWMAGNEYCYLDEPHRLEYPTETWAAQELRKGTTLWMISEYALPPERDRFRKKASELLDRGWKSLMSFDSRDCTRPLALALQQGYLETCLVGRSSSDTGCLQNRGIGETEFGAHQQFVHQKEHVRTIMASPRRLVACLKTFLRPSRWLELANQTWIVERCRRLIEL